MMDREFVREFVEGWVKAWNAHDLDALLAHFGEEVVFTSPVAAQLLDGSDGVIRGKAALRAYWAEGPRRIPDLRFEVVGAYVGVRTLVIHYRNQKGGLVNEVLTFDGSLVVAGHGTYLEASPHPAGALSD
jgi:ketosteroid isomerase-like protein